MHYFTEEDTAHTIYSKSVQLLLAIHKEDLQSVDKLLRLNPGIVNIPSGNLQVTPIQLACAIKSAVTIELVNKLLSYKADVTAKDQFGRTALHYAVLNKNAELVTLLINSGADVNSEYIINYTRNLHISNEFGIFNSLPLPECHGCTPLHLAVKKVCPDIVQILLENGASTNIHDEHGITPLLLASGTSKKQTLDKYEDIVSLLISHKAIVNLCINYTGTTALHHSITVESFRATKELLDAGATMRTSLSGLTPLHEAASKGHYEILNLLLKQRDGNSYVNRPDNDGRTALHKVAFAGSRDCVKLLVDHGADLSAETNSNVSVMDVIFSHVPRPVQLFTEIFDTKIKCNIVSVHDIEFKVHLDFDILCPHGMTKQMAVITAILFTGKSILSTQLLQHPLVETFLTMKWNRLQLFFSLLIFLHVLFVTSLSTYVMLFIHQPHWAAIPLTVSRAILLISSLILVIYTLFQSLLIGRIFLKQYELWLNLLCTLTSFMVAILGFVDTKNTLLGEKEPSNWVLHVSSIIVLIAWIELMLLIGRHPSSGYYVLMFSVVLRNVLKVLLTFVCLIIGFTLSFSIQFHKSYQFQNPWLAFSKTVVMMSGEFEYNDLFSDESDNKSNYLPMTSRVIFIMFIILTSIVLMNLMLGLAIRDIQSLQKEGCAKRLTKQATFLSILETFLTQNLFFSIEFFTRKRCLSTNLVLRPGQMALGKYAKRTKCIPSDVIESIITIAVKNYITSSDSDEREQEVPDAAEMFKRLEERIEILEKKLNVALSRL